MQEKEEEASFGEDDRVVQGSLKPFLSWLDQRGVAFRNGVKIQQQPQTGYRLVAKRDASKGEVLVHLPSDVPLMLNKNNDPPLLTDLIELIPSQLWGVKLGLRVLLERSKGIISPHGPYVAFLPMTIEGVPIFFSKEEIEALQYPPVERQIALRSRFLATYVNENLNLNNLGDNRAHELRELFNGNEIDLNALGWGMAAVLSRAFSVRPGGDARAMLPLIDMCNHSFKPNCEVVPETDGADAHEITVSLRCLEDVREGDELFIRYGDTLTNDDLLLDYGFVDGNNPHDSVDLSFDHQFIEMGRTVTGLPARSLSEPWRASALNALRIYSGETLIIGRGGNGASGGMKSDSKNPLNEDEDPLAGVVDARLRAVARLLATENPMEMETISMRDLLVAPFGDGKFIIEREAEALRHVAGIVAILLSQFQTAVREDEEWLEQHQNEANYSMRTAVMFRVAKKHVLAGALGIVNAEMKKIIDLMQLRASSD